MFDDTSYDRDRAQRMEFLRAEVQAGTYHQPGDAIAARMERHVMTTPIGELLPSERALFQEYWTEHNRTAADDARRQREWRSKVRALNAAETPPRETFPQRQAADRRAQIAMGLFLVFIVLIVAYSAGLVWGMR